MLNTGPHGLSEVLYAFTSATNNNGSAFAGLGANGTFYNLGIGVCMLVSRFLVIVPVMFFLIMLPISIGGLGLREAGYVHFLAAVGVHNLLDLDVHLDQRIHAPFGRGVDVAVVLGERLLALHHAGAGALAQFLDQGCGDFCHG